MYPLQVRPCFSLNGKGKVVVNNRSELVKAIREGIDLSPTSEVAVCSISQREVEHD